MELYRAGAAKWEFHITLFIVVLGARTEMLHKLLATPAKKTRSVSLAVKTFKRQLTNDEERCRPTISNVIQNIPDQQPA